MTWIDTVAPGTEDPDLRRALASALQACPPEYRPDYRGDRRLPPELMNDSIVHAHSLLPAVLEHVFAGYGAMLDPQLPLSRREHELIALTVSTLNRCFH